MYWSTDKNSSKSDCKIDINCSVQPRNDLRSAGNSIYTANENPNVASNKKVTSCKSVHVMASTSDEKLMLSNKCSQNSETISVCSADAQNLCSSVENHGDSLHNDKNHFVSQPNQCKILRHNDSIGDGIDIESSQKAQLTDVSKGAVRKSGFEKCTDAVLNKTNRNDVLDWPNNLAKNPKKILRDYSEPQNLSTRSTGDENKWGSQLNTAKRALRRQNSSSKSKLLCANSSYGILKPNWQESLSLSPRSSRLNEDFDNKRASKVRIMRELQNRGSTCSSADFHMLNSFENEVKAEKRNSFGTKSKSNKNKNVKSNSKKFYEISTESNVSAVLSDRNRSCQKKMTDECSKNLEQNSYIDTSCCELLKKFCFEYPSWENDDYTCTPLDNLAYLRINQELNVSLPEDHIIDEDLATGFTIPESSAAQYCKSKNCNSISDSFKEQTVDENPFLGYGKLSCIAKSSLKKEPEPNNPSETDDIPAERSTTTELDIFENAGIWNKTELKFMRKLSKIKDTLHCSTSELFAGCDMDTLKQLNILQPDEQFSSFPDDPKEIKSTKFAHQTTDLDEEDGATCLNSETTDYNKSKLKYISHMFDKVTNSLEQKLRLIDNIEVLRDLILTEEDEAERTELQIMEEMLTHTLLNSHLLNDELNDTEESSQISEDEDPLRN